MESIHKRGITTEDGNINYDDTKVKVAGLNKNINYDEIYNIFHNKSQLGKYYQKGYRLLKDIKKICKCSTDDILKAQKLKSIKKSGSVFLHTSIYDFGITTDDIRKSENED